MQVEASDLAGFYGLTCGLPEAVAAVLGISLASIFILIRAFNNTFQGNVRINADSLEQVIEQFHQGVRMRITLCATKVKTKGGPCSSTFWTKRRRSSTNGST